MIPVRLRVLCQLTLRSVSGRRCPQISQQWSKTNPVGELLEKAVLWHSLELVL